MELWAFLICEKWVSEGRSAAIETNIPNTNEIRPSSMTATRIAANRSRFRRGLGGGDAGAGGMSGRTSTLIGGIA